MKKIIIVFGILFICTLNKSFGFNIEEAFNQYKEKGTYSYNNININSSVFGDNYIGIDKYILENNYIINDNDKKLINLIDKKITTLSKSEIGIKKIVNILDKINILLDKYDFSKLSQKNQLIIIVIFDKGITTLEKKGFTEAIKNIDNNNPYITGDSIDLLKNQEYKIQFDGKKDLLLNEQPIFYITRSNDIFNVQVKYKDLDTGKMKENTYSNYKYNAGFYLKNYLNKASGYKNLGIEFLKIYECHYRYEYIEEDTICNEYYLPIQINNNENQGLYREYYESSKYNYDEDYSYNINIEYKSKNEVDCNIRGKIKSGNKIYYTSDSKDYYNLGNFSCFISEEQAIEMGYDKNFLEKEKETHTK